MSLAAATFGQPVLGVLTGGAIVYGLARLYLWARRESPLLANIVAVGFLLRLILGGLLFSISAFDLPFLQGLHSSDGYWNVAIDARAYVNRAARAAVEGLSTIDAGDASPAYVRVLALWMRLVGISPVSGTLLNLTLYPLLCGLLIYVWRPRGEWRHDLPCVALVGSLSFAPGLVAHATQPLKDDLFTVLTAVAGVGAFLTLRPMFNRSAWIRPASPSIAGCAAMLAAIYLIAGIRPYYAFIMLLSLAAVSVVFAAPWGWDWLRRSTPRALVMLVLTGAAYVVGAGPDDVYLRPWLTSRARVAPLKPANLIESVDIARMGFETSGGATNVVVGGGPPAPPASQLPPVASQVSPVASQVTPVVPKVPPVVPPVPPAASQPPPVVPQVPVVVPQVAPATPPSPPGRDRLTRVTVGLATYFVPLSLLKALSIVNVPIGRGLGALADLDTVFVDVTMLASLALVYFRWETARKHAPYVCFLLVLGCATVALTAYVVTNFGTMFRLRLMGVVPFWLLVLATSDGRLMSRTPTSPERHAVRASPPAPTGRPN